MAQQGEALQAYNNELVKCIEELCVKRDELHKEIIEEEEEKQKLQNDLRILTERLAKVNESLTKKIVRRKEFDTTIAETEAAYIKILESSQTLLHVLKKETQNLGAGSAIQAPQNSMSSLLKKLGLENRN